MQGLKTVICVAKSDQWQSDLNLLQMQKYATINVDRVGQIFVKKDSTRLFTEMMYFEQKASMLLCAKTK